LICPPHGGGAAREEIMKSRILNHAAAFLLITLSAAFIQKDLGAQGKKESLVTSGVKLKPILIGKAAADKDRSLSDEGQFDGYLNLVIDTPYQIWGEMGTYIHLAAYDPKFNAASDAMVYMDGKAFGKTDKTGTFVFSQAPNPDMSYGNSHTLDVVYSKGGKKYHGSTNFNAYPRTQGFESASVFVYTDRGVYNPGQTIHIRSIGWGLKDDFFPLKFKQLEFLLKNDRGQVVAGGGVETDKWGIASMDIPLPENAPEGKYTLNASYDRESATADLRIERFMPPVIEIKHNLGRFLTKDIGSLPFDVTLGYFGGGAFKSGKIDVSVKAKGKIAFEDKKTVKGPGPHGFTLDKAALDKIRKSLNENDTVQVKIAVTDEFGRMDEVKRDMRYTSNPWVVVVEMDKDQYTTGETAHVMIRAADLDKVPARGKKVRLEIEGKTYTEKTDDGGIAKFDIKVPAKALNGQVFIEEIKNPVAYAYINWIQPRPMSSEIPKGYVKEKEMTDIVIRFPTDFEPREDVVHVDIVDNSGALIGAALIPVSKKGDRYVAKGKFPAPAWGSMLLTLFCVGAKGKEPVGLLTDGQNLPVLPGREIKIEMAGLPKKASPGEKIKVNAVVKDASGQKIDAAVGASIVDEAVLSMLDPLEKTPMDKFYNPQLKVLSTTGSKILTWPVVTRNWGSPLYDIALPPFGFRAGGENQQAYEYKEGKKKPAMKDKYEESGAGYGYGGLGLSGTGKGGGGSAYGIGVGSLGASTKKSKSYAKSADMAFGALAGEDLDGTYWEAPDEPMPGKASPGPKVTITIRTNFAETSLWAPDLEAKKGKIELVSTLPDSITTQTVTLLASDDKGAVGMLRKKIDVQQDLYVRSNLPATLTVGDSVEVFAMVKNLTKGAVKAKVSLKSESIEVVGGDVKEVKVPAEGVGVAGFMVKPKKAGKALYEVTAQGGSFKDVERREIFIRPLGLSDKITARGSVAKKKNFKAKVKVSGKDQYLYAFMNVSFPTAVPMIQGMDEILGQPGGAIDFVSSKALITAMVYQYMVKYAKNEDAIDKIEPFLQQLMAALLMTQNSDGGWGWHFLLRSVSVDGKTDVIPITSNPYMTAQSLEALVEMKRAGLPVPESAVGMAMQALTKSVSSDNLWSVDDIAFWEGSTKQVQEGISAEIFRVMADACEVYPSLLSGWGMKGPMDKLMASFKGTLDMEEVRDPMGLSNAAMGVYTWAKLSGQLDKKLEDSLRATAKKLILLRKEAYWEPSWFNAFGGTIEATTAALVFMHRLDSEGFESEIRRSLQYILSTQESFGAWHNARGTAAAIRALLLIPPTEKEVPSSVKVFVNDQLVRKVDIDPDDPYLSAVSLRQVEISEYLKTGDNSVEVVYDGNLKAPVKLHLEKWSSKKAYSAVKQKNAPDVYVKRTYKGSAKQGAPVEVQVKVSVKEARGPIMVTEPIPSNGQVEAASLDKLLESGAVKGYELESGAVKFYLAPEKKGAIQFSYRLSSVRKGEAVHPGTLVSSVAEPDAFVSGKPTTFKAE